MQVETLRVAYPGAVLRQEKKSGTMAKDRFVLNVILDMIGKGDKLVVWKLDRLAGIAAAKAKGKHLGRKVSLCDEQRQEIRTKKESGMNPTTLSKEYGVSRGTIYNVIKEATLSNS
jgi:DNA invertase Pin-like site-specific DNA recombinase